MASWMVHLRIADILLNKIDGLAACQFGIGNVAPDSGVADANGRFLPPKEITHYSDRTDPPSTYFHRDACFYRDFLLDVEPSDTKRFSFLLGYLFHIVTDNLWIIDIWRPTKDKFFDGFSPANEYVSEVKGDWVGQDFLYLQQHSEALFYQLFLDCAYEESFFDLLPQKNIQLALQRIKDFYVVDETLFEQRSCRDYLYLSKAEMDTFVADTAVILYAVYERMGKGKKRPLPSIKRSLLEILSPNEILRAET